MGGCVSVRRGSLIKGGLRMDWRPLNLATHPFCDQGGRKLVKTAVATEKEHGLDKRIAAVMRDNHCGQLAGIFSPLAVHLRVRRSGVTDRAKQSFISRQHSGLPASPAAPSWHCALFSSQGRSKAAPAMPISAERVRVFGVAVTRTLTGENIHERG